jgi:hypothetical protein|tara:strand:+ start:1859 stop:2437 length:579 start_codon:yes stop_codon:yes gene_type:complete
MSNESLLKKEFKEADVQRVRNLVNKDYSKSTKTQTGYKRNSERYREGDIWEEGGRKWTIKNNIKQNITKLDNAKKALRTPLSCPNCGGPMKHHLAKKMFKIHGFCFDPCTVEMENDLKKAGLYEQYEQRMMQGNLKAFAKDIEQWAIDHVNSSNTFVTEAGDTEDWKSNSNKDRELLENVKKYLGVISGHIK